MRRLTLLLFIFTMCTSKQMKAQYAADLSIQVHPGFLIAHREDVRNLEAHTFGFEAKYTIRDFKKNLWANYYRKPKIALSFMYIDLGIPELTGKIYSILPSFETAITKGDNSYLSLRIGTGIGYITRKFDAESNRRNQAIGSHINASMQLFSYWNYESKKTPLSLNLGLGITHFSNGSFRVPNLGVNIPSLVLGVHYGIKPIEKNRVLEEPKAFSLHKKEFYVSHAFKERTMSNPKGFQIWNIGFGYNLKRNMVNSWRVGGDLFFDKTHPYVKDEKASLKGISPTKYLEIGVYGGHMWLVSKTHLFADIGFYAYKPSSHKFFTYQRIGIKYHFTPQWAFNFSLKTHFGIADYFSWGLGYLI